MTIFSTRRFLTAFAVAAFALPVVAQAAQLDMSVVTVSTAAQSPARLDHAIAVAANKVCSGSGALSSDAYDDCFGRAVAEARTQRDSLLARNTTTAIAFK